ncbi:MULTISPECIES: DHHA1 domain-containing protein [Anaeromyxobacter]|uniref:alanyl-tRNA editing protein n=3 Tax=Anaeromyxobacteraceae TaxID=1524215 RepID=UPI001F56C59D|nr:MULTISPECIES: DHHA1 domain-containing protein [unclassified Anaeromyxobacter]
MTERLYLADSGLLEFEATVTSTRPHSGRTAVLLDRTAFYPEGGGQPADRGTIGGVPVVDVQDDGGEILHVLDGPAPAGPVACRVDGARRRDHVQQHHGQHLLSAAFEATRGARTLSFHLGEVTCTIDLDVAALGDDALRAVEAAANDLVFRDLPVVARELSAEELAALPLRKAPTKGARVVVVSDPAAGGEILDASPCGGTHPRRTGEVGAIAVLGSQKWGAGSRVEFVCGGRVVAALSQARSRLGEAARALRCAPAELPAVAARAAEDGAARRKEAERLTLALAAVEAERLAAKAGGVVRAVVVPPAPGAAAFVKAVAAALAASGRVALVGAVEDGRAHLAFARPRGEGPHLGELVRAAAAALSGKGGGAPDLAQGSGPDGSRLEAALAEAEAALGAARSG